MAVNLKNSSWVCYARQKPLPDFKSIPRIFGIEQENQVSINRNKKKYFRRQQDLDASNHNTYDYIEQYYNNIFVFQDDTTHATCS